MKRIAIQGELGSFHDITAHEYFQGEQIELICCATFEEVFENIKRDPTIIGICAIEHHRRQSAPQLRAAPGERNHRGGRAQAPHRAQHLLSAFRRLEHPAGGSLSSCGADAVWQVPRQPS